MVADSGFDRIEREAGTVAGDASAEGKRPRREGDPGEARERPGIRARGVDGEIQAERPGARRGSRGPHPGAAGAELGVVDPEATLPAAEPAGDLERPGREAQPGERRQLGQVASRGLDGEVRADEAWRRTERAGNGERRAADSQGGVLEREPSVLAADPAGQLERPRREALDADPRPDCRGVGRRGLDDEIETVEGGERADHPAGRRGDPAGGAREVDPDAVLGRCEAAAHPERAAERRAETEAPERRGEVGACRGHLEVRLAGSEAVAGPPADLDRRVAEPAGELVVDRARRGQVVEGA